MSMDDMLVWSAVLSVRFSSRHRVKLDKLPDDMNVVIAFQSAFHRGTG